MKPFLTWLSIFLFSILVVTHNEEPAFTQAEGGNGGNSISFEFYAVGRIICSELNNSRAKFVDIHMSVSALTYLCHLVNSKVARVAMQKKDVFDVHGDPQDFVFEPDPEPARKGKMYWRGNIPRWNKNTKKRGKFPVVAHELARAIERNPKFSSEFSEGDQYNWSSKPTLSALWKKLEASYSGQKIERQQQALQAGQPIQMKIPAPKHVAQLMIAARNDRNTNEVRRDARTQLVKSTFETRRRHLETSLALRNLRSPKAEDRGIAAELIERMIKENKDKTLYRTIPILVHLLGDESHYRTDPNIGTKHIVGDSAKRALSEMGPQISGPVSALLLSDRPSTWKRAANLLDEIAIKHKSFGNGKQAVFQNLRYLASRYGTKSDYYYQAVVYAKAPLKSLNTPESSSLMAQIDTDRQNIRKQETRDDLAVIAKEMGISKEAFDRHMLVTRGIKKRYSMPLPYRQPPSSNKVGGQTPNQWQPLGQFEYDAINHVYYSNPNYSSNAKQAAIDYQQRSVDHFVLASYRSDDKGNVYQVPVNIAPKAPQGGPRPLPPGIQRGKTQTTNDNLWDQQGAGIDFWTNPENYEDPIGHHQEQVLARFTVDTWGGKGILPPVPPLGSY